MYMLLYATLNLTSQVDGGAAEKYVYSLAGYLNVCLMALYIVVLLP
jgi:hypothetical protein